MRALKVSVSGRLELLATDAALILQQIGKAFEGPSHCWAQMLLLLMQHDLDFIRALSGGGVCGHRCLHVDDVSHRIFSRSFRKYVTGAKVASPNLPKYLSGSQRFGINNWQMCQNLFGSPQHNSPVPCAALELLCCFPVWITGMN